MNNIKTNWNLSLLYSSLSDPNIEKDIKNESKIIDEFNSKWRLDTTYLTNEKQLLNALKDYEKVLSLDSKYYYYSYLLFDLDSHNVKAQKALNKFTKISTEHANKLEFFGNNLSKISKENQQKFLKSKDLSKYHRFLSKIFEESKYILSSDEEKIINLLYKPAVSNWSNFLKKQLTKTSVITLSENGKKEEKTFEELLSLLSSTNKKVRDNSAEHVFKILDDVSDFACEELNSFLETTKIIRDLRGFKRYDSSRHLADDIPSEVVDNLIDVVWSNLDIVHDYYKLKAKLFKVDKIKYYERNVPFIAKDNKETQYNFNDSIKIVQNSLSTIDKEFLDTFNTFLQNGYIDVYPKKGKTGGGYCMQGSSNIPAFVLLNHTNKINDVLTLAHEMGHAIHHTYFNNTQPDLYASSSLAVAEVASTLSEEFAFDEILKTLSPLEAFSLKFSKFQSSLNTIFRQISFYQIERDLYKKFDETNYLTKQEIQDIFKNRSVQELGKYIDFVDGAENVWVYVSHFRYGFYVYTYASGQIIAKSLKRLVQNNNSAKSLIDILKAGSSKSTVNLFNDAKIDITKKDFFENAMTELKKDLHELEKQAKELNLL